MNGKVLTARRKAFFEAHKRDILHTPVTTAKLAVHERLYATIGDALRGFAKWMGPARRKAEKELPLLEKLGLPPE